MARRSSARWLSYVNSDLHPAFHPLFGPARFIGDEARFDEVKDAARKRLRGLFESAEKQLEERDWLAGFRSFADPYFYITLRWAARTGVDLSGLPNIAAFKQRMEADAGVQAALKAEGLA
jgi:glutathione S-transferase